MLYINRFHQTCDNYPCQQSERHSLNIHIKGIVSRVVDFFNLKQGGGMGVEKFFQTFAVQSGYTKMFNSLPPLPAPVIFEVKIAIEFLWYL